ncbi:hypothetical protein Godav_016346 [Gossypium davidsonii]|uniref:Uncharacterized protein n=1 Tax=Gossypium davidsonii TaxID=34287 RepID=A0A7J8RR13_GOSDV|nr:hypothetical protein [Gossypium davidsonii]
MFRWRILLHRSSLMGYWMLRKRVVKGRIFTRDRRFLKQWVLILSSEELELLRILIVKLQLSLRMSRTKLD